MKKTCAEVAFEIVVVWTAIKLARSKLHQTLQFTVQHEGSWPFKQRSQLLVFFVVWVIQCGKKRVEINDQNMILNIAAEIMLGFGGYQTSAPCIQVRAGSIHTQIGFSTYTDNNLVMLMSMLVGNKWKLK